MNHSPKPLERRLFVFLLAMCLTVGSQTLMLAKTNRYPSSGTDPLDSSIVQKPTDISPLLIGESVPLASLPDVTGKMINLKEKLSQKPTILIFYRGGWCPFCNKQLAGIQTIEGNLRTMGYQIIAISTDSPEYLAKTVNHEKLTYTLLSDSDLSVSKQFGIAYAAPANYEKILQEGSKGKNVDKLLPVPSVFIVDTKGVIQFEYINPDFKQRISPAMLQSVAQALKKEL
ncbi:peroxiredoxin-like family protein [Cytophagaceae bacterium DM2B3-1]|uniref:thioredoxin-dependent peroxiredoxin n=1 Tax=Xanthocytophaga flava TaxID=3048013 RepID=A0ABT7CR74_9BACT|nr:peroxiredoxin-like family protein [Xanthocytophaga flavus]MDJ1466914.1 peroxiredoxin-like family protein [Xanthocytophaga flavus]MDJ1496258.1 peroxiredoxin-like family protein [Xanthocytophaga flavus]